MKRTVFGLLVMSSLVGVGSVGVYYAQGKLAPQEKSTADADQDARDARARQPQPIPVTRQTAAPKTLDPYDAEPSQQVVASEDRYQAEDYPQAPARIPADDIPDAAPVAGVRAAPYDAEPAAAIQSDDNDIPPADAAAPAPSGGPFAGRNSVGTAPATDDGRYAEQPAAAEVVEPAQQTGSDAVPDQGASEPRRLSAPGTAAAGNPLRPGLDSQQAPQTPSQRYGDEPFPAESANGQPLDAQPVESAPAAAPLAAPAAVEPLAEGTGRPGDPQLNGAQAPALTIEKTAPPEIQIGKPAKFTIKVRNAGTATAHEVEVHDSVPQGTQLLDSTPPANRGPEGELLWSLGSLKPGEEQTVELSLMPTQEGEIGSVATVRFHAQASVRTLATKPMLAIEVLGPSKVNKGEQLSLRIKLSNPGSGAANGIMLTESVPQGLTHAAGRELEFELGTLKPGETRELDLMLNATEAGPVVNVIRAEGEASLVAEAQTQIEIVAPQLQVALTGPKLRYLERNATHNISVSNPGTAAAKNIDLVAVLPRTLKFVEANNGGQFDEATHAVYWNLEELPPQETGTVKLTTLPLEAGDAKLLIKSSSQSGLKDEREEVVTIEGLAAINFQITDVKDPIEVGGETAFEVRVTNQGTKAASNVRLAVLIPSGMKPLSAEGPVRYQIEGQRVLFEPLRQLAPKADTAFNIKVQATEVGDQRVEVQLATDEIRDPISKQESTRVYGDE